MGLQVYTASVTSSQAIRKQQERINAVLTSNKIEFEEIDIAIIDGAKDKMRQLAGNDKLLPPQFFFDNKYLGDYTTFDEKIEDGLLKQFCSGE
eukprot:m.15933 g.15933  ORF g.15933 m.15933 type:complete len:93 (+) comp10828_c0_seq1:116-394(+)